MKVKSLNRLCLLATVLLATGLGSSGDVLPEETGPGIGQRAPAFTLKDQNGNEVSLDALLKKGPVALVFYRSADWCLYCKLQLIQLQRNLKEIEASGGQVVGISYDSMKILKRFADREKIAFPLLSDVGSKTIDAYDIRSKQTDDGSAKHGAFVLDQNGIIRARPVLLATQRDQLTVETLVKALKEAQNVNGETKQ